MKTFILLSSRDIQVALHSIQGTNTAFGKVPEESILPVPGTHPITSLPTL